MIQAIARRRRSACCLPRRWRGGSLERGRWVACGAGEEIRGAVGVLREGVITHAVARVLLKRTVANGGDHADDDSMLVSVVIRDVLADGTLIGPKLLGQTAVNYHHRLGISAVTRRDPATGEQGNLHHLQVVGGGQGDIAVRAGVVGANGTAYDRERAGSALLGIEGQWIDGGNGGDARLRGEIPEHGVDESCLSRLALDHVLTGVENDGGGHAAGVESGIDVLKLAKAGEKEAGAGKQQAG